MSECISFYADRQRLMGEWNTISAKKRRLSKSMTQLARNRKPATK